jgi:uncharacterized protein
MRRFDEAGFSYGVRVTVTERSLPSMRKSVEYLAQNFRPTVIHLEPAFEMGRCTADGEPPPSFPAFLAGYRECRAVAAEHGVRLYYSGATLDKTTSHFCGVTQDSFAVTTEGVVSSCYETFLEEDPRGAEFFYGRLNPLVRRFEVNLDRLQALRGMHVQNKPYCADCFCRWHCAGDCHHKGAGPGEEFRGTPRCMLNQELTKDLLIEKVRLGGGAWKERI